MTALASAQRSVSSVRITRHSAAEALSAFVRDLLAFVAGHLLLLTALAALVLVVFLLTRPRVH